MKVFVTGSTGLLGSTLLRLASPKYILGASYNINKLVPNKSGFIVKAIIRKKQISTTNIIGFLTISIGFNCLIESINARYMIYG